MDALVSRWEVGIRKNENVEIGGGFCEIHTRAFWLAFDIEIRQTYYCKTPSEITGKINRAKRGIAHVI